MRIACRQRGLRLAASEWLMVGGGLNSEAIGSRGSWRRWGEMPGMVSTLLNTTVFKEYFVPSGDHCCKSKVNNWGKCLAISQVTRAKLYNRCLLFIFKKVSLSYSSSQHLLFGSTTTYAFVPSLVLAWEPSYHLSPLFSPPHQPELRYKPIIILALKALASTMFELSVPTLECIFWQQTN